MQQAEQHNVSTVSASGRETMASEFATAEPSLVILDLRLGEEDGLDLLREIRSAEGAQAARHADSEQFKFASRTCQPHCGSLTPRQTTRRPPGGPGKEGQVLMVNRRQLITLVADPVTFRPSSSTSISAGSKFRPLARPP